MKQLFTLGVTLLSLSSQAQLVVQNGATFFIDAGATVTVQGDVTSNANITGTGKLIMKGTALQNLNMNGFQIPNLEIDNTSHVALAGLTEVKNTLTFVNGKIQLGNFNLILDSVATFSGQGVSKFVETNGTGELRKEVSAAGSYTLPVGLGTDYTPVSYTITGGTFTSAFVGARAVSGGHPARHPRTTDYLNQYWTLNRSGVTGTVSTVGTYVDPSDVTGTEADLRTMTYNGSAWTLGTSQDNAANTVTAPMSANTGDLYAMNRFVLASPKAFLQGAFNTGTGLMNDLLRNSTASYTPGVLPVSNLIPTSDPYRNAPYNSAYTHTNNSVAENLTSTAVLNDLANSQDQIVDWVFLELRNTATSGNAVLQTRSALIQRDGDVVDIDGISPIYFKNVDAGSFSIGVRHRNHIGIFTNPTNFTQPLGLATSAINLTTIASTSLMGSANSAYFNDGVRNMLYSGNANFNIRTSYSGSGNDASYLLSSILSGNPSNNTVTNVYSTGDVNMNRRVTYSGSGNDASFILATPLSGVPGALKTEVKPN